MLFLVGLGLRLELVFEVLYGFVLGLGSRVRGKVRVGVQVRVLNGTELCVPTRLAVQGCVCVGVCVHCKRGCSEFDSNLQAAHWQVTVFHITVPEQVLCNGTVQYLIMYCKNINAPIIQHTS